MYFTISNSYVNYSVSDIDEKELVLEKIFVDENERKQGIGTKLVKHVIQYAKEHDFETVGLYVCSDGEMNDEQLIEWYSSLGFESDGDDDCLMTYRIF